MGRKQIQRFSDSERVLPGKKGAGMEQLVREYVSGWAMGSTLEEERSEERKGS